MDVMTNDRLVRHGLQAVSYDKKWLHFIAPSKEELGQISEQYNIPHELLAGVLDPNERPRMVMHEETCILVIHVPYKVKEKSRIRYRTKPVVIMQQGNLYMTFCDDEHIVFDGYQDNRNQSYANGAPFIWLQAIARYYHCCLDELNVEVTKTEMRLQKSIHNRDLYAILDLNKSLVFFAKSLKLNDIMLRKYMNMIGASMQPQEQQELSYVLIELKQVSETVHIYNMNVSNLMDAYAAIIENNVSIVVKTLTAATFILTIPLAIASLYGMNSPLPFQESNYMLLVLFGISIVVSGFVGWKFYKKKLF